MDLRSLNFKQQNWHVTVCSGEYGWIFYCAPTDGEPLTNHQVYANSDQAADAARKFVDRVVVRLELGDWVDSLLESGIITPQVWESIVKKLGYLMRD